MRRRLTGAARRPSFPDSTDRDSISDRPRRASEWSPSSHGADAARALGEHRRVAGARFAPRAAGAERHRALRRAHALQGHGDAHRPRTSRRRSTRSAARWTPSPPRNTPATTSRCSTSTCRLRVDVLSDIVMNPAFSPDDIEREKKVVLEEIKMVEDTPDDLVHELFTENFWADHPLGRPILGTKDTVESLTADGLRRYFRATYTAPNLIVAAVGNVEHEQVRDLVVRAFEALPTTTTPITEAPPRVVPCTIIRNKELEQSHVCLGTRRLPQDHEDRYSSYVLNTDPRRLDELAAVSERAREARPGLRGVQRPERVSRRRLDDDLRRLRQRRGRRADRRRDRRAATDEGRAARRRGAAARQGSSQGQPDAEPREHVEPDVAPRAAGDLLRSAVRRSTKRSKASSA